MPVIVVSNEANGSRKNQLINQKYEVITKWFSLQNNILDGSFKIMPSDDSYEVGYISSQVSNSDGSLNPAIDIDISEAHLVIPSFQIESYLYGTKLKDFTVKAYRYLPENGSFEFNDLRGWERDYVVGNTVTVVDSPRYPGKKCLKITSPDNGTTAGSGGIYSDWIDCQPGDVISGKTSVVGKYHFGLRYSNDIYEWFYTGNTDNWLDLSWGTLTIPAGVTKFRVWLYSFQLVGNTYYDDIVILKNGQPIKIPVINTVVTNNDSQRWKINFDTLTEINEIHLSISKIDAPNKPIWLTEVGTLFEVVRTEQLNGEFVENALASIIQYIFNNDMLNISTDIENKHIQVSFTKSDVLKPKIDDISKMRNIHTVMCADERQTFCRVEITYTNPYLDEDTTFTSSGTAYNTSLEELADGVDESKYKWFNLHDNKLDGSFHPIDGKKLYPVGWWSNTLSDANGNFSVPVEVTVTFSKRPLSVLKVDGDDKLDCYPVNFTLQLLDANGDAIYTEVVNGNTQVHWIKNIVEILEVYGLKLQITKINKPYSTVKLTELFTAVKEVYENDQLISVDLLEETSYVSGGITLGAISSNEVDIEIDNSDGRFNIGNTQSKLHGKLKKNRRVRIWFGAEVKPGEIEWYEYGTFWTTEWNVPQGSMTASTTARDRINLLTGTDFINSQVYTNISVYNLFELVLEDAGLNADEYIIDIALQDIIIPYAWFEKMTHKQALELIAGCVPVEVFCDRHNRIIITYSEPTPTVLGKFDDDLNIFDRQYPSAWAELTNYVEVAPLNVTVGDMQTIFTLEEPITIPPNEETTLTFSFNGVPCMDISLSNITAEDMTYKNLKTYCWGFEITLVNNNNVAKTLSALTLTGKKLAYSTGAIAIAQDKSSILNDGKIPTYVENRFIQSMQYAQYLADYLLAKYKNARHDIEIDGRGDISLKLLDKVEVTETDGKSEYKIIRSNLHWDGALEIKNEAVKL